MSHHSKKLNVNVFSTTLQSTFVILYLHGNMSNRLEALQLLDYLPPRCALACFDFMGCGLNQETDIVTLGISESEQTSSVADCLRNLGYQVILWGRSMGASTALLNGRAEAIVADSAFRSFRCLCK